ncbi:MAG TPA: SIR2 family protein [Nitrospiraceae bacterium]
MLGAGASCPQYPTGEQLVTAIRDDLKKTAGSFYQTLKQTGCDPTTLDELRASLGGVLSIDVFLSHHKADNPDLYKAGKRAIAATLLVREDPTVLEQSWYKYLWHALIGINRTHEFFSNEVRIITYNYDRSLEQFLFNMSKQFYPKRPDDGHKNMLACVPILHLHGMIGPEDRPYTPTISDPRVVMGAANDIHLYTDSEIEKAEPFRKAQVHLQEAQRVYFLGFGFDPINLDRLGRKRWKACTEIVGTCYGVGTNRQKQLKELLKGEIESVELHNCDCMKFAQNFIPQLAY